MIKPSIRFRGIAAEAIDFYEIVFSGTNKLILKYGDMGIDPSAIPNGNMNLIGHAEMTFCGTTFTFCDVQDCAGDSGFISFMIIFDTEDELKVAFSKLLDGGEIIQELAPQFYAKLYGWVKDKFGVEWQVITKD